MERLQVSISKSYITGYDLDPTEYLPEYKRKTGKVVDMIMSMDVFEQMCKDATKNVMAFNRRCAMIMNAK